MPPQAWLRHGAVLLVLLGGCAWQRIDTPPAYKAQTLPMTVGLRPSESPNAKTLAPDLAAEFQRLGLFQQVIYPYRSGDPVDCVFDFDATSTAEGSGVGAGIASGLTFGLAGTVVGPSVKIAHDVSYYLSNDSQQIARDTVHAESEAEFGVFANTTEVATKQVALQNRRIAVAIAEKLNLHRPEIASVCTGYADPNVTDAAASVSQDPVEPVEASAVSPAAPTPAAAPGATVAPGAGSCTWNPQKYRYDCL